MATSVIIYRRHSVDCKHARDRYSRRCDCTLWLQYQDRPGHQMKLSAHTNDWSEAEQAAARIKNEGNGAVPSVPEYTLASAVEMYVADKRDRGQAEATVDLADRLLQRLMKYSSERNIVPLRHVTPLLLTDFRRSWDLRRDDKGQPATHAWITWSSYIRAFFKWCHQRGLIIADPSVTGLQRMKIKTAATMPYSEAEIQCMLDAIPTMPWSDKLKAKAKAIVLLGRHAGLAARDIGLLRRDQIDGDSVVIKRAKTGVNVAVPLPSFVVEALQAVENPRNPEYFFFSGCCSLRNLSNEITKVVSELERAGKVKKVGTAVVHRLRDAYAVNLILAGVSIQDVSQALGHSSIKVTEAHYSPWIKERQIKLAATLRAAWAAQGIQG